MADRKPGPVRPPVLEGEAKAHSDSSESQDQRVGAPMLPQEEPDKGAEDEPTPTPAPEDQAGAGEGEAPREEAVAEAPHSAAPAPPLRPHRTGEKSPALFALAGAGGALGGVVLAYGLALAGLWPAVPDDDAETIATLSARIVALESRPVGVEASSGMGSGLEDRVDALEAAGEAGNADDALARAEAAEAAAATLSERLDAVSGQIEAMAGAAGEGEGEAGAAMAALDARLDEIAATAEQASGATTDLDTRVAMLEQALAEQQEVAAISAERDRLAQWPAALAALRGAVEGGTSFAEPLQAVAALAPTLEIPEPLAEAAAAGIAEREPLRERFEARIPDMLRAAPADPEANLFESILAQAGAAVALRPAGDVPGDSPQAELARAEAALEAGAYSEAQAAIARLPEPMQAAAGDVVATIALRATAEAFLDDAETFSPGSGSTPSAQDNVNDTGQAPQEPQE